MTTPSEYRNPGPGRGDPTHAHETQAAGHHHHGHDHEHPHGHDHPAGIRGFLLGLVKPHSHDSADSVDSALDASAEGIRALKISLVVLLLTALAQAVVVWLTGSVALLADTVHNFSDALTAVPLWIAFILGRRAASRRYTYGYDRAEDLAGIFIVAMIALSAVLAGWESIRRLIDPQPITNVGVVIAAGLIGAAGNELVALYRIRVGRRIGSAALVADGLHARTDGLTSLAVVIGAIGVAAGFPLADPLIGLVITAAILIVLKGAARDVYRRLMDAVEPDVLDAAEASIRTAPGVLDVERLRVRWTGHRIRAEAAVTVDAHLTVTQGHDIAVDVHHRLLHDVPKLIDATVHVSPAAHGTDPHHALAHHNYA
ncbi:cation diffusion facilitator family transporter [Klenkia sp. PcliD-1-E]|uniref:cation diffusion facilitator family transporter n=1 Tax=Klenkia sp. PcliD-1-E TaxID=2954492 RepID=UPI00209859EE|nr:cation diffusion facilitator family transporter [Klenkia sp. PcliD-1-E]MCO7222025.1 cation diffusion facilitator family transporter [Klenkia sp. PcliD-1-E]